MKALNGILDKVAVRRTIGETNRNIREITFDSRQVKKGDVFIAIRGVQVDGHQYIDKAIENGATVIVGEELKTILPKEVTYIEVENSSKALGRIASNFYEKPSQALQLIGVTGTNGKTTTATLLYKLFMQLGYKAGLLSTIENKIGRTTLMTSHTTPDAITLNRLLADMVAAGCDYVFMEVSSHAVHQERIAGLHFAGGIFTNISHDHLDYHGTFRAYIEAKKRFFDELSKTAFALTNLDDRNGLVMLQNTKAKKRSYSLKRLADFKAKIIDNNLLGLQLEIDGQETFSRLIGEFNAYNLLTIYATAILLGQDKLEILTALSELKTAEGRFDYITDRSTNRMAIVDYAHTPDALEKVLSTIEKLRTKNEQIITVVGCGGDRDKRKRPKMAKIAAIYSDQVILTSDNPRSESPESIIADMEKGLPPDSFRKVLSIINREQAIKTACRLAQNGDIILVAGKGHEKYQEVKGVKHPFDDKEKLQRFLLE